MSDESAQTPAGAESTAPQSTGSESGVRASIDKSFEKVGMSDKYFEERDRRYEDAQERREPQKPSIDKDPRSLSAKKERGEREKAATKIADAYDNALGTQRAFFDARPHIDRVRARFPDMKPAELLGLAVQLEKDFPKDPKGTADRLAQLMFRQLPFRKGKVPETAKGVRGALDRAFDFVGSGEADDMREPLYELGPQYAHVWKRIDEITEALEADPMAASARLAAFAGMPVTEGQHLEIARSAELHMETARVASGIDRIIQSGKLPGIEREDVQRAIVDVLNDPKFERIDPNSCPPGSAEPIGVDAARTMELMKAYNSVMESAKAATVEHFKAKTKLSIGGGSPGAAAAGALPIPSRAQALARALGDIGVR